MANNNAVVVNSKPKEGLPPPLPTQPVKRTLDEQASDVAQEFGVNSPEHEEARRLANIARYVK